MGKFLRGRRRMVALLGVLGAASAVAVGLAVSLGGAANQPSTEISVTANAAHARVVSQSTVDVSSLPQLAAGESSGNPAMLKDLSPMGEQALEAAKQNASALAPTASEVVSASPKTPGGAILGHEGLADSATICSYFGAGCQPPDMAIASDGTNVVQVVNTSLAVYDAKTGAIKAGFPKGLQAFFGVPAPSPAGCDSAHANQPFLSDPRA